MDASRILTVTCCALVLGGVADLGWASGNPGPTQSPSTYPPARYWHVMTSNGAAAATTSRIYMFGGNAGRPGTAYLNDLWYYSASSGIWTSLTPTGRSWPQLGRGNGALSCGSAKCVLFSGTSGTKDLNETWVFAEPLSTEAAVAWTQVACSKPGTCPAARIVPLMAFDPTRGYHVSVGGSHDFTTFGDTWTFNGSKWTLRSASSPPAVRSQGSAAFVPSHVSNVGGVATSVAMNEVVIFGGNPYPNAPYPAALCNMYAWNGSAWQAISTNQGPCLIGATMAWDTSIAGNPRLMVAGGFKDALDTTNTETWYFTFTSSTSGTWTQASGCAPLMRAIGGYDVPSKKLVFFGGSDGNTGYAFGNTLLCP